MRHITLDAQIRHLITLRGSGVDTYSVRDRSIDDLRFEAITDELEHQGFRLKWIQDTTYSANFRLALIMVPLYLYLGWEVTKAVL